MQEADGGEPIAVLTPEVKAAIMKNISRRMTPQPLKIRADVDMTCFAYDGVLHIQASSLTSSDSGWCHHIACPLSKDCCQQAYCSAALVLPRAIISNARGHMLPNLLSGADLSTDTYNHSFDAAPRAPLEVSVLVVLCFTRLTVPHYCRQTPVRTRWYTALPQHLPKCAVV